MTNLLTVFPDNSFEYSYELPAESASVIFIFLGVYGILFFFLGLFLLAQYLLTAIPLGKIGKKLGYDKNFLAWIPFVQSFTSLFMLSDLPGNTEFSVHPTVDRKLKTDTKIGTKKKSFLIFLGLYGVYYILTLGITIIGSLVAGIVTAFSPEIGSLVSALTIIPAFLLYPLGLFITVYNSVITFVYLRDLMHIFFPDRKSNAIISLIVAITNNFTGGIVLPIALCVISRKEPLPEEEPVYTENEEVFSFNEEDIGEPPYYHDIGACNDTAEEEYITEDGTEEITEEAEEVISEEISEEVITDETDN